MKLFTISEIKQRANIEIGKLTSENKALRDFAGKKSLTYDERIIDAQKQYNTLVESYKKHKEEMMTEMAHLQQQIQIKKEILYGLIEKQDELDERERIIREKEVAIQDKETYISSVLQ